MCEGWLIYNRDDYEKNSAFADRFLSGCSRYGLTISLQFREDLCVGLSHNRLRVEGDIPDFAINRTRDWLLGRVLEQAGCRAFNSAEAARVGNDKIESHLLAARLGLSQVDMAFCPNVPEALALHGLGYPVVVKDPRGHGGSGVFWAGCERELLDCAACLNCDRVLLQRPCGMPGVDTRVYVLDGSIFAAVRRRSDSDFRANLSLGGSVELHDTTLEEREMVHRILATLPLDYAGIDFIYDGQGRPLFNEIEDAVGSRSLYMLGCPDPAEAYMAHIAAELGRA